MTSEDMGSEKQWTVCKALATFVAHRELTKVGTHWATSAAPRKCTDPRGRAPKCHPHPVPSLALPTSPVLISEASISSRLSGPLSFVQEGDCGQEEVLGE